ncbi:MAG: ParB/RepB/Spo0J family partition protein [Rhodospirillaceae bacterium]|nr:ParB/RepB/Spo0J family partition protein [Rhodospirillaceae bacterium]
MSAENKKSQGRGLGRGLSALLGDDEEDVGAAPHDHSAAVLEKEKNISLGNLHPGKYQPRHGFKEEELKNLANSIRTKGVLQPLLVRPHPSIDGAFEIIAGERRWRAAQLAQVHELPVIIRDLDDRETLEVALIENLQRQDLSPIEEAMGYERLRDEFSHTQEALADALGKSRPHVANMLRLLSLPESVKDMIDDGRLSAGHARALLGADDPAELAGDVIKRGLNVRQTEALVKSGKDTTTTKGKGKSTKTKDADTAALERDLTNQLGLKVEVLDNKGKGKLVIHYENLEQLDGVLARIMRQGG